MRIEIIKQIDDETREVFCFNMFDLNAVFVTWHKETKTKGKRKWSIADFWDKYARVGQKMSTEPELPEIIRSEAISEIMKFVRVKTWDEWKTNN